MSVPQLVFEKKDLVNIVSCLTNVSADIRTHRQKLISDANFMHGDISLLDEYYAKRQQLIDANATSIAWIINQIEKNTTEGGDLIAVLTVIDREAHIRV